MELLWLAVSFLSGSVPYALLLGKLVLPSGLVLFCLTVWKQRAELVGEFACAPGWCGSPCA